MKRLSGNLVGVGLVALATSVVGVGALWAGSSAFFGGGDVSRLDTTDSSVPADDQPADDQPDGDAAPVSPDDPANPDDLADLRALVTDLAEQVEALAATVEASVGKVDTMEKRLASVVDDVDDVDTRVTEASAAIDKLTDDVSTAKKDAAEALETVTGVSTIVAVLERRTAKIDDEGDYGGPVNPSQFTRKLTTTDITGNWPLNRVSEKLRTDNLEVTGFGCSTDYRYNTVLVVNAFRWVECTRIAK